MALFAYGWYFVSAVLFVIAALTDTFDGYFARRENSVTLLGSLLDFTADKLLISAVLIILVESKLLPSWMVVFLIAREFIVMSTRLYSVSKGKLIPSNLAGKGKTLVLAIGVTFVLLGQHISIYGQFGETSSIDTIAQLVAPIGYFAVMAACILAFISCVQYLGIAAIENKNGND